MLGSSPEESPPSVPALCAHPSSARSMLPPPPAWPPTKPAQIERPRRASSAASPLHRPSRKASATTSLASMPLTGTSPLLSTAAPQLPTPSASLAPHLWHYLLLPWPEASQPHRPMATQAAKVCAPPLPMDRASRQTPPPSPSAQGAAVRLSPAAPAPRHAALAELHLPLAGEAASLQVALQVALLEISPAILGAPSVVARRAAA
mmetsp:Transcript_117253/g.338979  ORF Transcript_117253/g.338979 Transcript_117253/m.338979 type:complete len:205 (+) Transcript_117253:2514-3128(+)